ncbi:hypothetical protein [Neobacillus terrae]|uniref:hypothetical protein n=1 Tax=Neobacillus terrae TaxID=3034837 RepID=UPI00140AFEC9|nr:hypothetical protein [Neobacillus terrae]NHM31846.1 hypothetical protein [Neobacillus terrae]
MKKKTYLFIYIFVLMALITSPFWLWQIQHSKKLNVLIVDKTVPDKTYREHKGLVWVLNNGKYVKDDQKGYLVDSDYRGFKPEEGNKYKINGLPKNLNKYDVIYLTDQYGVYRNEFLGQNQKGNRSQSLYGGLKMPEVEKIEKTLVQTPGKTLVAEFNTFGSPTKENVRTKISNLFNLDWSGWIGRYFTDLNGPEVPVWVKDDYQKQKKWNFSGGGFVFVNQNDFVVVIDEKELTEEGALFSLTRAGEKRFNQELKANYKYWFDINEARDKDGILANYQLPVTSKGKEALDRYGIPSHFPAIISTQNVKYTSYYFAGDFADEAEVPGIYQTKGLDVWKKHFAAGDSFYWKSYVPIMKELLANGLHHKVNQEKVEVTEDSGININSRTGKEYIQIQKDGKWKDFLIKGVNIGMGKPGYFPGETAIPKDEYLRWFQQIGRMNANAIRIYTLHPPAFYEAFYEYNQTAKKPLFLFHGSWVNEEGLVKSQNAFAKENIDDSRTEIRNMINIIHGNAQLEERRGHASGTYKYDISKYVLGFIVGIEWDPQMVSSTNTANRQIGQYSGQFFKTEKASPFESWLAQNMDYAAKYESENYHWQHSMSFANWPTTDLLKHPSEPLATEDMVSVNPNHIAATKDFHSGLFASYHIYPYYPDFLNLEKSYTEYVGSNGKKSAYAGYLHDLIESHNMPVLVAEFGVPGSRGLTHKNQFGFNQGFHSEEEQGEIDKKLYQSIVSEGFAGGMVFTWQDEWFKRTWNTMDIDNPDRRPYWTNQQTNEQHFGLLGFEPGRKDKAILVDGESGDWEKASAKVIYQSKNKKGSLKTVSLASDSGYLYFLLTYNSPVQYPEDETDILLDTKTNQGQTSIPLKNGTKLKTDFGVDYDIKLNGPKESRVMVDSYYDSFYYQYGQILKMIPLKSYAGQKNNGIFHPIRLALNKQLKIPSTGQIIPFQDYETGVLKYGDANPLHKDFNSLTDISISKDKKTVEGRIPWQLLNVKDPSLKEVMGDLWTSGLKGTETIKGIRIAVAETKNGKVQMSFPSLKNNLLLQEDTYLYSWDDWNEPSYYERLKKSYDVMAKTYKTSRIGEGAK